MVVDLWKKVINRKKISEEGCWLYTGSICPLTRYGRVQLNGKRIYVHRLSCAINHELNLEDSNQFANHKCNNRHCFNPEHLYVGDNTDNQRDVWKDNKCRKGHDLLIHGRTGTYTGRRFCRICATEGTRRLRLHKKEQRG